MSLWQPIKLNGSYKSHKHFCKILFKISPNTADKQLNANSVVKQRHPGDEFPVSLKRIHQRYTQDEPSRLKAINLNQNEYFFKYKNAILSVLYRFLRTPKDMVRGFLVAVIFLPSRETPVEIGFYMRKIWDKHDDILLVLRTVIACGLQTRRRVVVYKCGRSVIAPHWRRILHFADL